MVAPPSQPRTVINMIDLYQVFFALVVLAHWSNQDVKRGEVRNLSLILPVAFGCIFFLGTMLHKFFPVFIFMAAAFAVLHYMHRRFDVKKMVGFADVIGLPFAIAFLPFEPISMIAFAVAIAFLVWRQSRPVYDSVLKTKIQQKFPLMPVLFLSFFVAVVTAVILWLLTGLVPGLLLP